VTDREILQDAGKLTAEIAQAHAESEFEKYRIMQDRLFESDFDRIIKKPPEKSEETYAENAEEEAITDFYRSNRTGFHAHRESLHRIVNNLPSSAPPREPIAVIPRRWPSLVTPPTRRNGKQPSKSSSPERPAAQGTPGRKPTNALGNFRSLTFPPIFSSESRFLIAHYRFFW
jgi:hypothetical protein